METRRRVLPKMASLGGLQHATSRQYHNHCYLDHRNEHSPAVLKEQPLPSPSAAPRGGLFTSLYHIHIHTTDAQTSCLYSVARVVISLRLAGPLNSVNQWINQSPWQIDRDMRDFPKVVKFIKQVYHVLSISTLAGLPRKAGKREKEETRC